MDFGCFWLGSAALGILERLIEKVEAGELKNDATIMFFEKSSKLGRGLP